MTNEPDLTIVGGQSRKRRRFEGKVKVPVGLEKILFRQDVFLALQDPFYGQSVGSDLLGLAINNQGDLFLQAKDQKHDPNSGYNGCGYFVKDGIMEQSANFHIMGWLIMPSTG